MTALSTNLFRNTMIATAALLGTVGSFGLTAAPVRAADAYYTAKLATPVSGAQQAVLGDALWSCAGDTCTGTRDTSRPQVTCERLAGKFGEVTTFATPKGELEADQLAKCNKKA
ncbi:MAG: hypothetical protein KGL48_06845 [Sphingomonadales bacterium]|nr:hypothetical protein [Sphingomonadales bacterium]MDE2569944.1 hypothetical protein [Sphingomonadales bacterium]